MRVNSSIHVLAKIQKPWIDSNGVERMSYSANVMQNGGEIIDTIRLTLEQYQIIEPNKQFTITADYGTGKNGNFLKLVDIIPAKNPS